jgi:DNA-damage-inducible protein D
MATFEQNIIEMGEDLTKQFPSFEDFRNDNGISFWWASWFMTQLGYSDMKSFQNVIHKAIKVCMSVKIDYDAHFIPDHDKGFKDYKLTRLACYLCAMNGDPAKEEVAKAQVYFAEQTRKFEVILDKAASEIERILVRDELKDGTRELNKAAKAAGVTEYDRFHNAGYIGLYNMNLWQLQEKRGLKGQNIADYMGRTELAANLFKVTQTEEKLKGSARVGQIQAENIHRAIATEVRKMVIANVGIVPEKLPVEKRIEGVKSEIKKLKKTFEKIDKAIKEQ